MEKTYEDLLTYDVWGAITLKASQENSYSNIEELKEKIEKNPAKIPHNPLLLDHNWVYNHVESILSSDAIFYQNYQGFDEYYLLFKIIIKKYSIDEDYDDIVFNNTDTLKYKWFSFAANVVNFFSNANKDILDKLFAQEDFLEYFLNHPRIYNYRILEYFRNTGISKLLEYDIFMNHYINDSNALINLIRNHSSFEVPSRLLINSKVIKAIAENYNVEKFYFNLNFIGERITPTFYIDHHKIYCDKQVKEIQNGILPCLLKEYNNAPDIINRKDYIYENNDLRDGITVRIFQRHESIKLDKNLFYKELSKYIIIGLFISRNYETDPYNLLIDIETLYNFAKENNKSLKGYKIYEFLCNYEDKDIDEIIDKYNEFSKLPLRDMLYDDWISLEEEFIDEINDNLIDLDKLPLKQTDDGITYYDISDVENPILVHNTSTPTNNDKQILELLDKIKNGKKSSLCLSLQNINHQEYYNEIENVKSIKLAFGKLDKKRVGIICHNDAYSLNANTVEFANYDYKKRLYTLKSFLDNTHNYNEIVYVIDGKPLLPIGIICDDEITKDEVNVAKILNIPILYRKRKDKKYEEYESNNVHSKHYTYTIETGRFLFEIK